MIFIKNYPGASQDPPLFLPSSDVYYLGAQVKDNGIYKGFESLLTEAKRVNDHGFLPSELKRAKKIL
jgi:hypothetical protein